MILTDKLKTGLKICLFTSLGFLAFRCSDEVPKTETLHKPPIVEIMTKVKKTETPLRVPIIKSIRKAGRTSFNFLHCSNVDSFSYIFEGNKINTMDGSIYNKLMLMEEEGPEYRITFWDAGPDGIVDKMKISRMRSTDLDTTDMLNFDFRTLKKFPILFPGYEKAEWARLPNKKGTSYNRDYATKDYAKVIEAIFK